MDLTPGDPGEVLAAVAEARATGRRMGVVGGATLASGAVVDVRLRTTGLLGPVSHEPADLTCTVAAGVRLADLQVALAPGGQCLPVWHPAPERATVGGLVAWGWGGLGRRLYGRLRDRILEVHVVTAEAKLVRGGGKVVKNVTGFDLPRLFFGSRGTLGVIVEMTLKAHPRPDPLFAVRRDGDPADLLESLVRDGSRTRTPVEVVLHGTAEGWTGWAFAPGPVEDATIVLGAFGGAVLPGDDAFRDLATDAVLAPRAAPDAFAGDVVQVSVPPARIGVLGSHLKGAERAVVDVGSGLGWATFGASAAASAFCSEARAADGSATLLAGSGEHTAAWEPGNRSSVELGARIRAAFDPDGILADPA